MIVKRILENKKSKLKYVVIPRRSDLKAGDYVRIEKIQEKEEQNGNKDSRTGK